MKSLFNLTASGAIALCLATASANATVVDAEGSVGRGLNDSSATAMDVGLLVGNGFFFDIDCASDCDASSDDDDGLDTRLSIFNDSGFLIADNDDSDFFRLENSNEGTDPGSDIYGDYDAFIGELFLNSGVYYAAVSYYSNKALSNGTGTAESLSVSGDLISGAIFGDGFDDDETCGDTPDDECNGFYQLQIRTSFEDYAGQLTIEGWVGAETDGNDVDFYKFTVRNDVSEVPEPAALGILGVGLFGFGMFARRQRLNNKS